MAGLMTIYLNKVTVPYEESQFMISPSPYAGFLRKKRHLMRIPIHDIPLDPIIISHKFDDAQ